MKYIYKYLAVAVLAIFATGCEEDLIVFGEDQFVQLQNANAVSITENSGDTVEVTAILGSPQASAVTVNFDVTGGDPSRYMLSPGASVSIPAGETSASIVFSAIDDDDINGDVDITIALSSSSGLPVGIGGEGLQAVSKTITIVDDNVPCNDYVVTVTTDRWGSENSWDIVDDSGNLVASDGPYVDGPSGFTETYTTAVTLPDGCYTFTMFDSYGDGMGTGTYSVTCGALTAAAGGPSLNTVSGFSESTDFCVNQ